MRSPSDFSKVKDHDPADPAEVSKFIKQIEDYFDENPHRVGAFVEFSTKGIPNSVVEEVVRQASDAGWKVKKLSAAVEFRGAR